MQDFLLVPKLNVQIKNKVKDSKFIGNIKLVDTEMKAKLFISKVKKKYNDATHNVFAYKIGINEDYIQETNDDGEPTGSSAYPILQVIEGEKLTNTVIVITRYFGGTKLGIGGLVRAYGDTAKMLIKQAQIQRMELLNKVVITCSYGLLGPVMGQVEAHNGQILDTKYDNQGCKLTILIKAEQEFLLKEALISKTANKFTMSKIEELYQ